MIKIVIISGPTASGKTAFAIKLCKIFGGEVVNADSVQIYKGFDIGSAKPTAEEQEGVPHHLLSEIEPSERIDADKYRRLADQAIKEINGRGKIPFLTGGTGLYVKAVLFGLAEAPPADENIRKNIELEAEEKGWGEIHKKLKEADPKAAEKISPNDKQRIRRAYEHFLATGKPISEIQQEHGFKEARYDYLHLAIKPEREEIYQRIDRRADELLEKGLIEEVKALLASGVSENAHPFRSHGYAHALRLLRGEVDFDEFMRTMKRDHRRYSKRQMTWLAKQPNVVYIEDVSDISHIKKIITAFIKG